MNATEREATKVELARLKQLAAPLQLALKKDELFQKIALEKDELFQKIEEVLLLQGGMWAMLEAVRSFHQQYGHDD